jgi:hypothetical protein
MKRARSLLCCAATLLAVFLGGCSLIVDFDRSLLVDASVDASLDGGFDAGPDPGADAGVDAGADAN